MVVWSSGRLVPGGLVVWFLVVWMLDPRFWILDHVPSVTYVPYIPS